MRAACALGPGLARCGGWLGILIGGVHWARVEAGEWMGGDVRKIVEMVFRVELLPDCSGSDGIVNRGGGRGVDFDRCQQRGCQFY